MRSPRPGLAKHSLDLPSTSLAYPLVPTGRGVANQQRTGHYLHASVPLFNCNQELDALARVDLRGVRTWTTPGPDAESTGPVNKRDTQQDSGIWQLWLGSGGTMSALHYDQTHNIFVQLHGALAST